MDQVLVAGGSHAELPLIEALHRMGFAVITTGNNTEGLGHRAADSYVKGDFSDPEWVLHLAKQHAVRGIVSGCNDFSYLSAAYACERLGLPGHDALPLARRIHHKEQFRTLLEECGLPAPKHICIREAAELPSAAETLGFPLLIKPIDLTGGKGVKICGDAAEMQAAFANAMQETREDHVIAEQMIKGENHGVSALIANGKVVFAFFDNEEYYLNKYLVSGAHAPADLPDAVRQNICMQIETLAQHSALTDGLFHCQCITNAAHAYLIDPCRRAPGDLYLKLVEYADRFPYAEAIVRAELGLPFEALIPPSGTPETCAARECIMTDSNGIYGGYTIAPELEAFVTDRLIWAQPGEPIEDYLKYKAGIVFFTFPNRAVMREQLHALYEKMKIIKE